MGDDDDTPPPDRLATRVQIGTAFSTRRGEVRRFVTRLEYWLHDSWRVVVRYDHDRTGAGGHDVTEEGLHRDGDRDGRKFRTGRVTGPIPAERAREFAGVDFRENAEAYVRRFEGWHDVTRGNGR